MLMTSLLAPFKRQAESKWRLLPSSAATGLLMLQLQLMLLLLSSSVGSSSSVSPVPELSITTQQSAPLHPAIPLAINNNINSNNHQQQQKQTEQLQPPRRQQGADDEYLVGVGIADITGPAADINLVSLLNRFARFSGSSSSPSAATSTMQNVVVGTSGDDSTLASAAGAAAFSSKLLIADQMGYAKPNQNAGGIHLRQFSRTIVIEDKHGNRVLYNSIDNGMISQLLRLEVLKRLKQLYGENIYNESNVMMSATHSHSCPGGFFQYMLYNIPSAGFISQTLEALVDGIERSVCTATENMKPAKIYYNEGELLDASVNRSPTSYENNPSEELQAYRHNTDKGMYLLKVVDSATGTPMAVLNWFAVHGTSMNNTNHLISSDNKGYASILFEQEFNPPGTLPGKGKFVAIFAQANEGDVSPNTLGPRCVDSGLPCDSATSTCGNPPRNEKCIAFGPGKDMFESTKIIAYKQYYKARQLFLNQAAQQKISGPIRFVHEHIDMSRQEVPLYKSVVDLANRQQLAPQIPIKSTYHTCSSGLGYSFAAGTTDGPGAFDFQQGDTVSTRYWNMVRDFLRRPSPSQMQCHHPKPILLSTGEMDFPYMWHPRIVPTQIIMIGQLAVAGLPGEFTTMAGRRMRNAIRETLRNGNAMGSSELLTSATDLLPDKAGGTEDDYLSIAPAPQSPSATISSQGGSSASASRTRRTSVETEQDSQLANAPTADIKVVLSGLSNIYTSYVTTLEEYAVQRYEGASTLYGPHTLQAYINQFKRLAERLARGGESQLIAGRELVNKLEPPDLSKSLFTLRAGVIYDGTQHGRLFGDVLSDVDLDKGYKCQEIVSVSFVAGNPRNDLRQEDSFLYVDKYISNGTWETIANDASWETKFIWERTNTLFGESRATVLWEIPHDCRSGVYRIRHYGAHKSLLQSVNKYSGKSMPFKVVGKDFSPENLAQLNSLLESAIEFDVRQAHEMETKRQAMDKQNGSANSTRPTLYSALNMLGSWFGRRKSHS